MFVASKASILGTLGNPHMDGPLPSSQGSQSLPLQIQIAPLPRDFFGFPYMGGTPKWLVYKGNPTKMDDDWG